LFGCDPSGQTGVVVRSGFVQSSLAIVDLSVLVSGAVMSLTTVLLKRSMMKPMNPPLQIWTTLESMLTLMTALAASIFV
jgi:heme/copper-type cytochrome/quinol oxidase subunit 1